MRSTRLNLKKFRVIFLNAVICSVIGATFGIMDDQALPWILGGLLSGAILGLCLHQTLNWLKVREERRLRGFLFFLILESLLVYYVVIPSYGAYHTVHPVRFPVMVTPLEMGINYEEVSFITEDQIRIEGWYIPSTNGAAIIAVHGLNGNRTHVMPYMQFLVEQGYGVLLFDLRAQGESGGEVFPAAWNSDQEILAALSYLKGRSEIDPEHIGALGLSAGAHAVIFAAAKTEDIKALFLDGTGMSRTEDVLDPLLPELRPLFFGVPMNHFHHVMIEFFSKVPPAPPIKELIPLISPRPIYFVAAGSDSFERAIATRYSELAGTSANLWIVPDTGHLGGIFNDPDEYSRRMIDFFDRYLLQTMLGSTP